MIKILFFLVLTNIAFSQIILQENDFASPGDTVRISLTNQTTLDYISTGSAFNWDFSNLIANSQILREFTSIGFSPVQFTFGIGAPQEYQASYFIPETALDFSQLNGFLPVTLSDARSYQKSTNDSITKVGYSIKVSGFDVAFKSDTIETKYKFPMEYQQFFTTKGYTFIDFSPAAELKVKQYRNVTSTVDGYGQLILPTGSYSVLRLKREIYEIDSIYQSFFGAPSWFGAPPIQTIEYEWIGQNRKDVLLKIVVNNANGIEQVQSIEYQDVYLGLDASIDENKYIFSTYPNPTNDLLNIKSTVPINKASLYDAKGMKLKEITALNKTELSIDVRDFSPGFYFLNLDGNSSSQTIRVTKN